MKKYLIMMITIGAITSTVSADNISSFNKQVQLKKLGTTEINFNNYIQTSTGHTPTISINVECVDLNGTPIFEKSLTLNFDDDKDITIRTSVTNFMCRIYDLKNNRYINPMLDISGNNNFADVSFTHMSTPSRVIDESVCSNEEGVVCSDVY